MTRKPVKTHHLRRSRRGHKRKPFGSKQKFRDAYLQVYGWVGRNASILTDLIICLDADKQTKSFEIPETWHHCHYLALIRQLKVFANQVLDTPHFVDVRIVPASRTASLKCHPTTGAVLQDIDADAFVDQLWPNTQ
jgi:hypothetical protein